MLAEATEQLLAMTRQFNQKKQQLQTNEEKYLKLAEDNKTLRMDEVDVSSSLLYVLLLLLRLDFLLLLLSLFCESCVRCAHNVRSFRGSGDALLRLHVDTRLHWLSPIAWN